MASSRTGCCPLGTSARPLIQVNRIPARFPEGSENAIFIFLPGAFFDERSDGTRKLVFHASRVITTFRRVLALKIINLLSKFYFRKIQQIVTFAKINCNNASLICFEILGKTCENCAQARTRKSDELWDCRSCDYEITRE